MYSIINRLLAFASRFILLALFSASIISFSQNSVAQAKKGEPKKQTLSFEDELVEGQTQKPELFYLFQKKNFNYKRLIKLRENFIPEMKQDSEVIQRGRSLN